MARYKNFSRKKIFAKSKRRLQNPKKQAGYLPYIEAEEYTIFVARIIDTSTALA